MPANPIDEQYNILLLSDEEADFVVIDYILQSGLTPGCTLQRAATVEEAMRLLSAGSFDLCIADAGEGNRPGLDFARAQRQDNPNLPIILLTDGESETIDRDVEATGAIDFLPKGRFPAYRLARVVRRAIERQSLIARIQRLEQYDELTGLAKRDMLLRRLGQMVALGRRSRIQGALILFRLWELDQIAETFGPAMVDYVLVRLAGRLAETVRESDLIGRWHDDTFAVVGANIEDQAALETLMDKIAGSLEESVPVEQTNILMKVTTAAVRWPQDGDDVPSLASTVEARVAHPPNHGGKALAG